MAHMCVGIQVCKCAYRIFLYLEKTVFYPLQGVSRGILVVVFSPVSEQHRTSFLAHGLIYFQSSFRI